MSENPTVLYEGLFLMGQSAGADMTSALAHVREVLDRAEAEVITLAKWDERKLAYEIKGQKRGTYILSLFKARGTQIANIERDCNLSEQIIRAMIVRGDHIGEIEIEHARADAQTAADEQAVRGEDTPPDADAKADDQNQTPVAAAPSQAE